MDQLFFPGFETEVRAERSLLHCSVMRRAKCAKNGANASLQSAQLLDGDEPGPQHRTERPIAEDETARAQLPIELLGGICGDERR